MKRGDALEIYYDGDCTLCRACAAWAARRDRRMELDFTSFRSSLPESLPLDAAEHRRRLWVRRTDGTMRCGWAACREVLERLPGWRWLARVTALPPLAWAGELGYLLVARFRGSIPVPFSPPSAEELDRWGDPQPGAEKPGSGSPS